MERDKCFLKDRCKDNCSSTCIKYYKTNYFYDNALIPLNRRKHLVLKLDLDERDRSAYTRLSEIEADIVNKVDNGENFYICSKIAGNGKTSWALRLVESYLDKIWYNSKLECKVLFINVPKYLLAIKENIDKPSRYIEHINKNCLKADLVIWDDIGTKVASTFEHENLLSKIDHRINSGKSNIYTSNLLPAELEQFVGARLYSRIVTNSETIHLQGKDKRNLEV